MFEGLLRELRRLEGVNRIPVSIQSDEDGYIDRQCPTEECMFEFKVHAEDWRDKIHEMAVCPFCGHSAQSDNWNTQEQSEHFRKTAISYVNQQLGRAMQDDAARWNRQQPRDSFIKINMKVEGPPTLVPLSPAATDPMRLRIECSQCKCRYAVIGAAYFCPSCSYNDAEVLFSLTISGIRNSIGALSEIRTAVSDPDTAENVVRSLMDNGLQNAITAFQRYAEALYIQLDVDSKPRKNAFQNLAEGSKLWHNATGKRYSDYLTHVEIVSLERAFQQRHLLAHTQGIVDQGYIDRTNDVLHQPGQRLVIGEATVLHYLTIIEKLAAGLLEIAKEHLDSIGRVGYESQ